MDRASKVQPLSVKEWDEIDLAIARAVKVIRTSGGYGRVELTFEEGTLAFSRLHISESFKAREPV